MDVKTILVPFDFGDPALHALAFARGLAERFGAALHLLHVVPSPHLETYPAVTPFSPAPYFVPREIIDDMVKDAERRLEHVLGSSQRQAFRARTFVTTGDPRQEILAHAAHEHVDLIVMGTHGRTGAAHLFLGSVAEKVVRTAPCPVLTVR